ncbi:hypothetical protein GCM10010094_94580 [Streptomyces flaveus]|uniref:Uncharacterized protein n=1 Tax=Streptomyces flaveus TaxID=66370 RepID=A0A917RQZ3_9ACTN|nr:hypothetical protein GCM10010094_94580 [Streptomyces flaveus]
MHNCLTSPGEDGGSRLTAQASPLVKTSQRGLAGQLDSPLTLTRSLSPRPVQSLPASLLIPRSASAGRRECGLPVRTAGLVVERLQVTEKGPVLLRESEPVDGSAQTV